VCGQVRDDAVGVVAARNTKYQKRFKDLLLSHDAADLAAGWELARTLGRPVVPLLWEMHAAERSNIRRQLVLLIAAVLAGGPAEDGRLFVLLDRNKPMLPERAIVAMLLALGPQRARPVKNIWARIIGPNKEPEPLLDLASRLACVRFPGATDGTPVIHEGDYEGDHGIQAAAAFAGFRMSPLLLRTSWRSKDRHAELFHRGMLLGDAVRLGRSGTKPPSEHLYQAKDLLRESGPRFFATHAAAMLLRARAGVLDPRGDRPDWRLLQLCASRPESREALRVWLPAKPLPRDEEPARVAVGYALMQPIEKVLNEYRQWGGDARIHSRVAVALAMRLAAGATSDGPIELRLPEVPEFQFAVWASGGKFAPGLPIADRDLQQLAELVADGRVSRAVVRRVLEEALWRWGSHPGLAQWREERRLIRDLLLTGSEPGLKYPSHLRNEQRYFATGLDKGDSFFDVAVALYEFLERPVTPVPPEYRLR